MMLVQAFDTFSTIVEGFVLREGLLAHAPVQYADTRGKRRCPIAAPVLSS